MVAAPTQRGGWSSTPPIATCSPAWCFEVRRTDGVVKRMTSHDRVVRLFGFEFHPRPGLSIRNTESVEGLSHKTTELVGLIDDSGHGPSLDDLYERRYHGSVVMQYAVDWRWPSAGLRLTNAYWVAVAHPEQLLFRLELRGHTELLERRQGAVYDSRCTSELGLLNTDRSLGPVSLCGVDITQYPETVPAASVVGTPDRRAFTLRTGATDEFDPAIHVEDYFAFGRVEWSSGKNAGLREQVSVSSIASGASGSREVTVTLASPMPASVLVGDQCSVVVGCDHLARTCRNKFSAYGLWFRGFETITGTDRLLQSAEAQ